MVDFEFANASRAYAAKLELKLGTVQIVFA